MKFNYDNQSGVTMIVAVMVMSAITIISITVAFFVIQEVRNTRSSFLSEPAIVAAESAGEQGIYLIKRGTFDTSCNSAVYTQLNETQGGNASTRIKKCITSGPATVQISEDDPLILYLYDPENINGNTCLERLLEGETCPANGAGFREQLYSSIKVKHLSGSGFSIGVKIDTVDGHNLYDDTVCLNNTTCNQKTFNIPVNIPNSDDERLRVSFSISSGSATAEVSTTGLYSGFPDFQTIDAEGCVGVVNISDCNQVDETYKRRINITVPK